MTVTEVRGTARQRMQVRKRNGDVEPVDVNKIVRAVERWVGDLDDVDPLRVATKTISGLYDGATTAELDRLSIQTAAEMIGEEPQYSRLAARLLAGYVDKEVRGQGIASFSQAIRLGHEQGLIGDETAAFVAANARKLDDAVDPAGDLRFEYFGLRTVYDRYLLRHPKTRLVVETPQYWLLRVACGLSTNARRGDRLLPADVVAGLPAQLADAVQLRHPAHPDVLLLPGRLAARRARTRSTSATRQVAQLSKFAGGIGISWSRVRSRGALIRGTNGQSNGIVPFLRTLDASVAAVNQGGRRKGAACVYLETVAPGRRGVPGAARQHRRGRPAHAQPEPGQLDPGRVHAPGRGRRDVVAVRPGRGARAARPVGRGVRRRLPGGGGRRPLRAPVKARDLYGRMMRTLAQTGNGWMTFKDAANRLSNQTGAPGNVVHLSNLCTEILEVTSDDETAVCNLGSVNLAAHLAGERVDWEKLRATVRTAVTFLDRVIDINYYPTAQAAASNPRWRPVGLGVMGLQDVFFALRLPFDSADAPASCPPASPRRST